MAPSILQDIRHQFYAYQPRVSKKSHSATARRPLFCKVMHHSAGSPASAADGSRVLKLCMENKLQEAVEVLDVLQKKGITPESSVYECLLNYCRSQKNLALARKIYSHMISSGLKRDVYIETKVVSMFVKCGSLRDALAAFNAIVDKNLYSWTVMLSGFVGSGCFDEALRLLREFGDTHLTYDGFVITTALKACGGMGQLMLGKEIHGCAYRRGYEYDVFVGNCLIDMYGECGSIDDARQVFERISPKDVVSWNSMLKGYSKGGGYDEFVEFFRRMEREGVKPNLVTWNTMISGSAAFGYAEEALHLFKAMQLKGLKPDNISCNALIKALVEKGYIEEALELIRQMQRARLKPDIVSWTTIIEGYVQSGKFRHALILFLELQQSGESLDEYILTAILRACAGMDALGKGKEIHAHLIKGGFRLGGFVGAALLCMYATCGSLDCASRLLSKEEIVSWNSLISGHLQNGLEDEATDLFQQLQLQHLKPDLVTWNMMINCLAEKGEINNALDLVHKMELAGIRPDLVTWNTLLKGFVKNGQINEAKALLNRIETLGFKQNPSSWNTLISNYVDHERGTEAFQVFNLMQECGVKPDYITIACILRACILVDALKVGKTFHGLCVKLNMKNAYVQSALVETYIKMGDSSAAMKLFNKSSERNIVAWNGLISGLANSGKIYEAQHFFRKMRVDMLKPDIISWTSIISGHIKNGNSDVALKVWRQMWNSGIHLDSFTLTAALRACADIGSLAIGEEIHGLSIVSGLHRENSVQSAIITMYSKCDCIESAVHIFEGAHRSSTVIWNSMISGYVVHGQGERAVSLFQRMQEEGIDANWITINGILSAYSMASVKSKDQSDPIARVSMGDMVELFSKLKIEKTETFSSLPGSFPRAYDLSEGTRKRKSTALVGRRKPSWLHLDDRRHRFDGIKSRLYDLEGVYDLLAMLKAHVAEEASV
ncbi:unnamed protein product [Victoria cruziana]